MKKYMLGSVFVATLLLNGCGGDSSTSSNIKESVRGVTELGRLAGATVKIYECESNGTKIEPQKWTETTSSDSTDLSKVGIFNSHSVEMDPNKIYTFEVSGGTDMDANDDGVMDINGTPNSGILRKITQGGWCYTCVGDDIKITYASEMQYQLLKNKINNGTLTSKDIIDSVSQILSENGDLDGDGKVDDRDLLLYDPVKDFSKLKNNFAQMVPNLIDNIHNNNDINITSIDSNTTDSSTNEDIENLMRARVVSLPSIGGIYDEPVTVYQGESVELIGDESIDPDGPIQNYKWIRSCNNNEWKVISDGDKADINDTTVPETAKYCYYRLIVTDNERSTVVDGNRNHYKEKRLLKIIVEKEKDGNKRPTALATANDENVQSRWSFKDIGTNDVVILNGSESHDTAPDDDNITKYTWYRIIIGRTVWKKIGEGVEFEDDLSKLNIKKKTNIKYYLRVTDSDGYKDNVFNNHGEKRFMNYHLDPNSSLNKKPIGILVFESNNKRFISDVTTQGDRNVKLDASKSRDDKGIVKYTFEKSEDFKQSWNPISACTDITEKTCDDVASGSLDIKTYWSPTFYRVKVTDTDGNTDYSYPVKITIKKAPVASADNRPPTISFPYPTFKSDGRKPYTAPFIKKTNSHYADNIEMVLDASGSTDNVGIVKYKFEQSTDLQNTWTTISEGTQTKVDVTVTKNASTITSGGKQYYQTWFRVTVYDAAGNESSKLRKVNIQK